MAATKGGVRMCVVTIGLDEYLLPAAAGLKVAELMQGAQPVRSEYVSGVGYEYSPDHEPMREVSWKAIKPAQVNAKPARARRQARELDEQAPAPTGAA
jgi:hypothetical protein